MRKLYIGSAFAILVTVLSLAVLNKRIPEQSSVWEKRSDFKVSLKYPSGKDWIQSDRGDFREVVLVCFEDSDELSELKEIHDLTLTTKKNHSYATMFVFAQPCNSNFAYDYLVVSDRNREIYRQLELPGIAVLRSDGHTLVCHNQVEIIKFLRHATRSNEPLVSYWAGQ